MCKVAEKVPNPIDGEILRGMSAFPQGAGSVFGVTEPLMPEGKDNDRFSPVEYIHPWNCKLTLQPGWTRTLLGWTVREVDPFPQ